MKRKTSNLLKGMLLTFVWISSLYLSAQTINFSVNIKEDCVNMPVSIPIDNLISDINSETIALYEITPSGEKYIYTQLESDYISRLWFILEGTSAKNSTRKFSLKIEESKPDTSGTDIHIYKSGGKPHSSSERAEYIKLSLCHDVSSRRDQSFI